MDLTAATWALVVATILVALITLGVTWRGWTEAQRLAQEGRDQAQSLAADGWNKQQLLAADSWAKAQTQAADEWAKQQKLASDNWAQGQKVAEDDREAARKLAADALVSQQRQYYANWQRSETVKVLSQIVIAIRIVDNEMAGIHVVINMNANVPKQDRDTYFGDMRDRITVIKDAIHQIDLAGVVLELFGESVIRTAVSKVERKGSLLWLTCNSYAVTSSLADQLPKPEALLAAQREFDEATAGLSVDWFVHNLSAAGPMGAETA